MLKPEFFGMESQSWCPAGIDHTAPVGSLKIDFISTDEMASLGKVNANLMCPAGFEAAAHDAVVAESVEDFEMGDRFLADAEDRGTTSSAVTAVPNEGGRDSCELGDAVDDREITTNDRMCVELLAQPALGGDGSGENDEATGLFVQAVDDAEAWPPPPFTEGEMAQYQVIEGGGEFSTLLGPFAFERMSNRTNSGRFFDHDDLIIEMSHDQGIGFDRAGKGSGEEFDGIA